MSLPYPVGLLSYGAGAAAFLLLTLLLLTAWRGRLTGGLLVAASGTNALWCGVLAVHAYWGVPPVGATLFAETVRGATWMMVLLTLLGYAKRGGEDAPPVPRGPALPATLALCVGLATTNLALTSGVLLWVSPEAGGRVLMFGHVLLSVVGMALVEQLYRNTRPEYRWGIKMLCLGLGGLFVYDFYMYADALLLNRVQPDVWDARGLVNAMVVPLIALSAVRNPQWSLDVFVSRHVVFHSAALLGAGLYLLLMAAAGYWIRSFGGSWGGIAQTTFLFGALLLLALLLFSGQLRSRVKVFVSKHFFRNKYDYRDEWLRFTQALSSSSETGELRQNIIRAVADIMESPGGILWMRRDAGDFHVAATYSARPPDGEEVVVKPGDSLPAFLEATGWVVYLDEYRRTPGRYEALQMPDWMLGMRGAWIIVPLIQAEALTGFLLLTRPGTEEGKLDWEDSDLLKTVGRQIAGHVALNHSVQLLAETRQFQAYNRLTAFIMHDLKNLIAQQSPTHASSRLSTACRRTSCTTSRTWSHSSRWSSPTPSVTGTSRASSRTPSPPSRTRR